MIENFQFIPLDSIQESSFNPRKKFLNIEELAEDLKKRGMLQPVLVRPLNGHYELVFGARRYRAARVAGLEQIPAFVKELNDQDVVETQIVENAKRDDLHPLEEAESYRILKEQFNYEIDSIAAKVGKSVSAIYQRLKLIDLIPEAKEAFLDEKITAGHAILIARLQPRDQKTILKECLEEWRGLMSVRNLAEHIDSEIHLDLNSASFSKKDPDLVPSAGPCTTCPKRTGFTPMLFPDIKKKDTCTDPVCFKEKVQAFIDGWLKTETPRETQRLRLTRNYDGRKKRLSDDFNFKDPIPSNLYEEIGQKKNEKCEYAQEGIVVEGHGTGTVLHVCIEPTCKIHRAKYSNDPEMAKWRAQQKAITEKKKREELARLRIVDEIMTKISGELSGDDLALVADQFFDELWDEYKKKILARHEVKPIKEQYTLNTRGPMKKHIEGLSGTDLCRLLIEMVLIRNLQAPYQGRNDVLLETAKRYQVDAKKIQETISQEWKEKEKAKTQKALKLAKKEKVKGKKEKAAAAKKKPESGVCRVCGCTEEKPCEGSCAWTDKTKTICTACQMAKEHHWEKQNLVTVASTRNVPMHDIYKCKKCGATAKRFGIGGSFRLDKKFAKREECPGPKVHTSAKKTKSSPDTTIAPVTGDCNSCTFSRFAGQKGYKASKPITGEHSRRCANPEGPCYD